MSEVEVLNRGKFLNFCKSSNGWEYAERSNCSGCVGILAVTEQEEIILVTQYRPPVQTHVLELPAGLVGDEEEGEGILIAADRELLEETGFKAKKWIDCGETVPSAGACSEKVSLALATGAYKVAEGGGVDDEEIQTHLVPIKEIKNYIKYMRNKGFEIDSKIYAGLWFYQASKNEGSC
ncbi:MAG: NUDIX hydrolase [Lentisphaeria bacterium]|nr:NUDIX hydrolase [Lentisphaeria bacterium]